LVKTRPRQKVPHVHCVTLDLANRFAFVCDRGLDEVMTYRFDAQHSKLTPGDRLSPRASLAPDRGTWRFFRAAALPMW
jgi:6-phosphogluconolactonase (cycloisomerase 2 family)